MVLLEAYANAKRSDLLDEHARFLLGLPKGEKKERKNKGKTQGKPINTTEMENSISSFKFIPSMSVFNVVLEYYSKNGDVKSVQNWHEACLQEDIAREQTIQSAAQMSNTPDTANNPPPLLNANRNSDTLTNLVRVHASSGDIEAARRLIQDFRSRGIRLKSGASAAYISAIALKHGSQDALRALDEEIVSGSFSPDGRFFSSLVSKLVKKGRVKEAEVWFKRAAEAGAATTNMFSLVIQEWGRVGRLDLVERTYNMLNDVAGIEPDVRTFSAIIQAHSVAQDTAGAMAWFKKMKKIKSIKADVVVYNILIRSYASLGLFQQCEDLVEQMVEEGIEPDTNSFCAIIIACMDARKTVRAEKWLGKLIIAGLGKAEHYARLMNGYAQTGDIKDAERVFLNMLSQKIPPSSKEVNIIISAAAKIGDLESAEQWFSALETGNLPPKGKQGNNPNDKFLLSWGDYDLASSFFGRLHRKRNRITSKSLYDRNRYFAIPPLSPDVYSLNTLLNACARTGNMQRAEELARKYAGKIKFSEITYNTMIFAANNGEGNSGCGDGKRQMYWFEEMKKSGMTPAASTISAVCAHWIKTGDYKRVAAIREDCLGLKNRQQGVRAMLNQCVFSALANAEPKQPETVKEELSKLIREQKGSQDGLSRQILRAAKFGIGSKQGFEDMCSDLGIDMAAYELY